MAGDRPRPRRPPAGAKRSGRVPGLIVLVVAVGAGVLLLFSGRDDRSTSARQKPQSPASLRRDLAGGPVLSGPAEAPFDLRYTTDWVPIGPAALAQTDEPPLAGIRREDGTGVMTVSVRAPVRGGVDALRRTLPGTLRARFPDVKILAVRPVRVVAGRALYSAFRRGASGRVQSSLLVPRGSRLTYSLDAVVDGDARETAQEVGAIFRTFSVARR